jgi:hypothetical protein
MTHRENGLEDGNHLSCLNTENCYLERNHHVLVGLCGPCLRLRFASNLDEESGLDSRWRGLDDRASEHGDIASVIILRLLVLAN